MGNGTPLPVVFATRRRQSDSDSRALNARAVPAVVYNHAMLRLLRRSLAAASLVLLLATVALWLRGQWRGDELFFTTYAVVPASTPDPYDTDKFYQNERP